MPWNRFYTSKADKVTFILGELHLQRSFEVTARLSGKKESYACYLDRESGVYSEHARPEEEAAKGEIGLRFFSDEANVNRYEQETLDIIARVDELKRDIEAAPIADLGLSELRSLTERADDLYADSMGYYFISQPEYTAKLQSALLEELTRYVPKGEAAEKFTVLIQATKPTCLELERRRWLERVVIPFKNGELSDSEAKKRIGEQVDAFKYLSASSQFDLWDVHHYEKVLKDDLSRSLDELRAELTSIDVKTSHTEAIQREIRERYGIPDALLARLTIIKRLSWLRLEAHLKGWQFFHYLGPLIARRAAGLLNAEPLDVLNLKLDEFYRFLESRLTITAEHKIRKNGNILVRITPEGGCEVFFGDAAKRTYERDIKEDIPNVTAFSGQTASGTGKVRGEVFLFKFGTENIDERIYAFPEGKILVAGQTVAQFMPAIRKASAIVTNEGGVLCHAAIVSRELKKPAIIGTKIATEILRDGDEIEMDLDKSTVTILRRAAAL